MRKLNRANLAAIAVAGFVGTLVATDAYGQTFNRFFDSATGLGADFFGLPPGTDLSEAEISNVSGGAVNTLENTIIALPTEPGPFSFDYEIDGVAGSVDGFFQGNPFLVDPDPTTPPQPNADDFGVGLVEFSRVFDGASRFTFQQVIDGIVNNADGAMLIADVSDAFGGEVRLGGDGNVIVTSDTPGTVAFVVTFDNGLQRVVQANFATPH